VVAVAGRHAPLSINGTDGLSTSRGFKSEPVYQPIDTWLHRLMVSGGSE